MIELFNRYCNYIIKEQYTAKYGSKSIGGCVLEEVDVEKNTLKINKYAEILEVDITDFCNENYNSGGSMFNIVYNATMREINDIKKIKSGGNIDMYMKMKRVLDSVSNETMTDEEWFMLEFLGEDYELPPTLKRIYIEETESKYSKIGYYKEIEKRLGKGHNGKGLYVVDNVIDYSSHEPFMDIVLWAVGLYRRLSVNGMANVNAYRELAKASFRKLICYRKEDGREVVATQIEQKKMSSKCYAKNIRVLDITKVAKLHIVAWLMTGDEAMYKGSFLECTNMKFGRDWSDNKVSVEEFCYRLKLGHEKIVEALQYMSSTEFLETDSKKLIEAVGKKDEDFLDSGCEEFDGISADNTEDVSMKEIIKTVANIDPLNDFENMAKNIAQQAYKSRRFVLSEKQRNIVIKVYNSCTVEKGELPQEVLDVIEYIKKYEGKNTKNIVKSIIKSVERYGKCSEKQLGVLQSEAERIKDEIDGTGIKKKRGNKGSNNGSSDNKTQSLSKAQASMLGEVGATNVFGISFDIHREE